MRSLCLFLLLFFSAASLFSQTFKPDANGYISDPAFKEILKKKQFVCGAFTSFEGVYVAQVFKSDGNFDFIDLKGNFLTGRIRDEMIGTQTSGDGMWDNLGVPVIEQTSLNALRKFRKGDKYGIITGQDTIFKPIFDVVEIRSENNAIVKTGKNYHLLSNQNDKWVLSTGFSELKPMTGLDFLTTQFIVSCDGKSGMMDNTGKMVIPTVYDEVKLAEYPAFIQVKQNGKYGWMTGEGKTLIPLEYDAIRIGHYSASIFAANKVNGEEQIQIYSMKGIPAPDKRFFNEILPIGNGNLIYYSVSTGTGDEEKTGIFDAKNQKLILEPAYHSITTFSYGNPEDARSIVGVTSGEKLMYGYIDGNGKEIVPPAYDQIVNFDFELAVVMKNGKYGIIDRNGKVLFGTEYEFIQPVFRSNSGPKQYAIIKVAGKCGLISNDKKVIIPAKYDELTEMSSSQIRLRSGRLCGVASSTGKILVPLKYDGIWSEGSALYSAEHNGESYMVDLYGNEGLMNRRIRH